MHMGLIAISGMCYDHKDEILLLLGGGGPGAEDSGRGSETTSEKESKVAK